MQLDKWTLIQFHTLPSDTYWIISSFTDFLTLSILLSGNFAMLSHSLKTTLWGHFISTLKREEKQKCWDLDNRSHEKSFWSWFVFLLDISFQRKCLCFNPPLNPRYNGIQQNTQTDLQCCPERNKLAKLCCSTDWVQNIFIRFLAEFDHSHKIF